MHNALQSQANAQAGRPALKWRFFVSAMQTLQAGSTEVVVVGDPKADDTQRLVSVIRTSAPSDAALLLIPPGLEGEKVRRLAPFAAAHQEIDGRPTAYLCRDFVCQLPTTDPAELEQMLSSPEGA